MIEEFKNVGLKWVKKIFDPEKDHGFNFSGPIACKIYCFIGSYIVIQFTWFRVKKKVDVDEQYRNLLDEVAFAFAFDLGLPLLVALLISLSFSAGAKNRTGRQMFVLGFFGAFSVIGILALLSTRV